MAKRGISKSEWVKIGILLVIFIGGVTAGYIIQKPAPRMPIINPADLNPALVEDSLEHVGMNHRISDFHLIDQNGQERSLEDLKGKIIIADFFFTTCPSICIQMTNNLRRVQDAYLNEPMIHILSHSVQPAYDTVPILRAYADNNGVDDDKWWLLTGDKEQIYSLARTSYFAVMEEGESFDEHDFIHTENIVVVDPRGRLRGFYDGTSEVDMNLLIEQVQWLVDEFKPE